VSDDKRDREERRRGVPEDSEERRRGVPEDSEERRQGVPEDSERLTILGDLFGEVMVYEPMLIKEIGVGGATVETRFPLHLNSLHDLRLLLGPRPVIVKGRVVHSHISDVDQDIVTYRSGVEFVEPSERVISAVVEYLDSVRITRGSR
jgi:hypothetical protein